MIDEATMLRRARAGLSPPAGAPERVHAALAAALAAAPPGEAARAAPRRTSWAPRLLVAAAIAASAGAGYRAGFRAGRGDARPRATARVDAPHAAAPPAPRASAAPREAPTDVELPRATRPRSLMAPPRPSAPESLAAEVRALRAVERALREHEPGLALGLLRELDRAVPDGKLVEEREATAAIARCALGEVPFGVAPGRDFRDHHPDSVYLERVQQACAESERKSPPAETHRDRGGNEP